VREQGKREDEFFEARRKREKEAEIKNEEAKSKDGMGTVD
jgi:hypothetical protein